mgnify:CR=1 FL=1
MTVDEFTKEFAQLIDLSPADLKADTDLSSIDAWDSVAYLTTMVMIDEKLGITLRPEIISRAKQFQDILDAVRPALSV